MRARSCYEEAPDLRQLAERIIMRRPEVAHVDPDDVLFLRDVIGGPKGVFAHCYSFANHPISFFDEHRFCIVVYEQLAFYLSPAQLALLVFHELMHIPRRGNRLVKHSIQDFATILGIGGVDWHEAGADVPDILRGES